MLDIAVAYNRYRFLGNEFLTWLWFFIETDSERMDQFDPEFISLNIGNRMVLENRMANGLETITIKGDTAGLEEGILALNKGAAVVEVNLIYKSAILEWQFSLKGESLSFTGLKLPETAAEENEDEMEAMIMDKIYLYEKPFQLIDALYRFFIHLRLSSKWREETIEQMRKWMQSEQRHEEGHPTTDQ
jgi:hypothetical protein